MVELYTNVIGTFALINGGVVDKILFPRNAGEVADRLIETEKSFCREERRLIEQLYKTGNRVIEVRNPVRFRGFERGKMPGLKFTGTTGPVSDSEVAEQSGLSEKEFTRMLSQVNQEILKIKIKEVERDQLIIQAVDSIDDLDESINKLSKRLREFYSFNFPELDYLVKNDEVYVKLVKEDLGCVGDLHPDMARDITDARKDTLGIKFSENDFKAVRGLAESISRLYESKSGVESYINALMDEVAPNMSALAGPLLGARLISFAGSMKRLSTMPASTIQVLGAEDAFFRFLRTKIKPPKHGVIFTLPEIRSAPRNMRGRISRSFAAKIAIAVRVDYFQGEFIGDRLRKDFLKRIGDLG